MNKSTAPQPRWQIYCETDQGEVFGCGIYAAPSSEDAIASAKKRGIDIKPVRYWAEPTTDLPNSPPKA